MSILDDDSTRPTRSAVGPAGADSVDTVVDRKLAQNILERGSSIGRYTVLDVLGQGGMGVIYRAYDPELNRNVALKLLRVRRATAENAERARARMLREAQALARLNHPNVIAVYDAGTYEDDVFITMELVEGASLSEWLKSSSRSREHILKVFSAAGHGLAAAHDAGLVHRDFKPSNVMVGKDGRVRVLDFGLAKAADVETDEQEIEEQEDSPQPRHPGALDSPLTLQGYIVGTPKYMAPEQLRGRQVSPRSDQFGFCVALFNALTGLFPFAADDLVELLEAMIAGKIREAPSERRLPAWLKRALHRGLAYKPADRFESMNALLNELSRERLKRRQLAVYLGLGTVSAATAVLLLTRPSAAKQGCPDPTTYLTRVWDDRVESSMRRAFASTSSPHAGATSNRVSRIFHKYANRWRVMRDQACRDTRERRTRSEQLFDRRVQCLERRRDQLSALTQLFTSKPDSSVVDRAASAAGKLGILDDCLPDVLLQSRVAPPDDAPTRAAVNQLRKQLYAAQAAYRAGRYKRARDLFDAMAAKARATRYEPLLAELAVARAQLLDDLDDRKGAEAQLRRAIELAAKHKYHAIEAKAWVQLLWVAGYRLSKHREAVELSLGARAAVARSGDEKVLRAQLLNNLASVAYSSADYKTAQRQFREALDLRIDALGADDVEVASSLTNLGLAHMKQGDLGTAQRYHQKAYRIRVKALGKTHPATVSSLNNLGILAERQGRFAEARARYTEALRARERLLGKDHKGLAGVINNLGAVNLREGNYEEAKKFFRRALALKERTYGRDHMRLTSTLDNLADTLMKQGKHAAAAELLQRSLAISKKVVRPDHPDVAYTLTSLGECYRVLQKAGGVQLLERALRIRSQRKVTGPELAETQFYLARALWPDPNARPRALNLARTARATYEKAGVGGEKMLVEVRRWLAAR